MQLYYVNDPMNKLNDHLVTGQGDMLRHKTDKFLMEIFQSETIFHKTKIFPVFRRFFQFSVSQLCSQKDYTNNQMSTV